MTAPQLKYCPYCGSQEIKIAKYVPKCMACRAVFLLEFFRYTRRSKSTWIEHTGSECPVDPAQFVKVQAGGFEASGPAKSFDWGSHPMHVTRYKLVDTPDSKE